MGRGPADRHGTPGAEGVTELRRPSSNRRWCSGSRVTSIANERSFERAPTRADSAHFARERSKVRAMHSHARREQATAFVTNGASTTRQGTRSSSKTGNKGMRRFAVDPELLSLIREMHAAANGQDAVTTMRQRSGGPPTFANTSRPPASNARPSTRRTTRKRLRFTIFAARA
jgi:hypothetical protein